MNILDIDAGNTRLKWRWQVHGQAQKWGAVPNGPSESMVLELGEQIGGNVIDMCRLSSVRSPGIVSDLCREIGRGLSIKPCLPDPVSGVAGLIVSEVEPSRLGCDRWLAMLGAMAFYPNQAVMVVDSGTALTLDVVGVDGVFRGGLICPGLNTMLKSMTESADLLVMPERPEFYRVPCFSSIQAIQNGALSMAAALVEKEVERFGGDIRVVLCGGDAPLLAENMTIPVDYRPGLIFDGLAVALPAEDAKD